MPPSGSARPSRPRPRREPSRGGVGRGRRSKARPKARRIRPSPASAALAGALVLLVILLVRSLGGSEAGEAEQTVAPANQPPEIQSLELELTRGNVVARPLGRDPDGDRFHYRYRWSVAGKPQNIRGALLRKNRIQPGETVEVEATPVDRHGAEGRPMRSSLQVEGKQP